MGDIVTIGFEGIFKSLRESRKMTQSDLAKMLGISKSMVSAYETGVRQPSHEVLLQMSRIFKVSIDYLYGNEDGSRRRKYLDITELDKDNQALVMQLVGALKEKQ